VRIMNQHFVVSATEEPIVLLGANVVVKGPPYLPSVTGDTPCRSEGSLSSQPCAKDGTCESCSTFNEADIAHMRTQGWNAIRLGVVWAGAQPRDEAYLDASFLQRLHAVLNLTDAHGMHVILDNHGDMVGSAGCGNGVPMWFQQKAAPDLIGKPLRTGFPYNIPLKALEQVQVDKIGGYSHCGDNATLWAAHAGDPNYNLKNECCQAMNSGNPGGLGYTTINQATMDYVLKEGPGRDDFVRFWRLMAEAVRDHPSAFAAELMNEPMSIWRRDMFETWKECAKAVTSVIPDMSVSICDTGEDPVFPTWLTAIPFSPLAVDHGTEAWIKGSSNVYYALHYPNLGRLAKTLDLMQKWNLPTIATEMGGCEQWNMLKAHNISRSYWHYSCYCDTGPWFGNRSAPDQTFGACILGWDGGNTSSVSDNICLS